MADLFEQFKNAMEEVKTLSSRPDNETLLKLYSLYKQSTEGDVAGDRPGFADIRGRAKYDAWAGLKGTSKEQAMQDYVDFVRVLKG